MNEQQQPNQSVSALDLWDILRRRKFYAIVVPLVILAAVLTYAFTAPQWFRARTLVSIELLSDKPLDPASRVREQLRIVREVVFSDAVFGTVVKEFELLKQGGNVAPERARRELESRIKIDFDGEDAFYIGFEGTGRQMVTAVTNRIAELVVALTNAKREERTEQEAAVIDAEVDRLRSTLAQLDSRIQGYKQSSVEELPERVDANLRILDGIQAQYRDSSSTLATEEARRAGIVAEMEGLQRQGMLETAEPVLRSPNQDKLDAARLEMSRLLARGYAKDHPDLLALTSEIASLERLVQATQPKPQPRTVSPAQLRHTQLRAELEAVDRRLASLRNETVALNSQLLNSRQRLNASPRHEQALAQMVREYDIAKVQYATLLEKQLEVRNSAQIQKIKGNFAFRIVEPARVPLDPFFPNRLRLLVIGLVAGAGIGLGAVFLAEHVDSSFKDIEEFQTHTGLPVLSIIPSITRVPKRPRKDQGNLAITAGAVRPADTIVTLSDPKSIAAEQFHILAMRLKQLGGTAGPRVFTVTSSAGGEGKTVASVNLAVALSSGARVLLIDADLRRPRVHQYLGLHVREGLGLEGILSSPGEDLAKYSWHVGQLTVLPGRSQSKDPLALLSSADTQRWLKSMRQQFQFIVIDSPPVLPVADGLVLAGMSDYILMVVRARVTTRAVVRRALESIDSSKLCGVILNDLNTRHSRYAYVYQYYENTYLRGA